MAAAWDAFVDAKSADQPAELSQMLLAKSEKEMAMVLAGLAEVRGIVKSSSDDDVGAYPDIVGHLGPHANALLDKGDFLNEPARLTEQCRVVFAGIDQAARYVLATYSPARHTGEAALERNQL